MGELKRVCVCETDRLLYISICDVKFLSKLYIHTPGEFLPQCLTTIFSEHELTYISTVNRLAIDPETKG